MPMFSKLLRNGSGPSKGPQQEAAGPVGQAGGPDIPASDERDVPLHMPGNPDGEDPAAAEPPAAQGSAPENVSESGRTEAGAGESEEHPEDKILRQAGGVDEVWYKSTYPDVAAANMPAVQHYRLYGWKEGRDPNPDFSTIWYLQEYRDVAVAGINPLVHFLNFGMKEGRQRQARETPQETAPWSWLAKQGGLFPKIGSSITGHEPTFGTAGRRKIIFAGHNASRTGAPLTLLALVEHFAHRAECEIFVFLKAGGPLLEKYQRYANVVIHNGEPDGSSPPISALIASLAYPEPKVAICNSAETWALGAAFSRAKLKVISLVHENLTLYPTPTIKALLASSDLIVFPAQVVRDRAAEVDPLFAHASIMPQGLQRPGFGQGDRHAARAWVRRQIGLPGDTKIVLGCGSRTLQKGYDIFCQMASSMSDADVHFVWVGGRAENDLELDKWMKVDAKASSPSRRPTIIDTVEDPEPYFLAADVFVLTSRNDSLPNVVFEAMSAGVPVVTFEGSGGSAEVIADGCGVTVPGLDVGAMKEAVARVLTSTDLAGQMAAKAKDRVHSRYEFSAYAAALDALATGIEPAALTQRSGEPKVFFSQRSWGISGVNSMTERVVTGLREEGIDARIVFWYIPEGDQAFLPKVEYLTVNFNGLPWATQWDRIEGFLAENAPCILVTNYDCYTSAVSPRLPSSVAVIGTARSDDDETYDHVSRLGRYWNRILTVSPAILDQIVEMEPGFQAKTHYIPNFVDRFAGQSRKADFKRPLSLFYSGGLLEKPKRIFDLSGIADGLEARGVPFSMTIAGDGRDGSELAARLGPHIERGAVRLLGRVDLEWIWEELRLHDVLLLTSESEGMPNSVLEAMAQGCVPVVSRLRSGIPELVLDGITGLTADIGNINQFVDAIQKLHQDRDSFERLSAGALDHVRANFSKQAVIPQYVAQIGDVWREITSGEYRRPYAPRYGAFPGISVPPDMIEQLLPRS